MSREWTTMSVHKEVYHDIENRKRGGESFNDVLTRLCEVHDSVDTNQ